MTALARGIGSRLGQAIGLLLAVVVVVFFLIQLAPGDAALYLAGDQGVGDAEFLAQVRADYGLDRPLLIQLGTYVGNVAQLNLGESIYFNEPVLGLIVERLFATVLLAGTSLLFAVGLGVAIGVYTARRPESPMSSAATVTSLVGFSTPVFYSAIMVIVLFAAKWSLLPVGGMEDVRYDGNWVGETIDLLQHLILPALSLGIIYLAIYSRLARASMLEVLESGGGDHGNDGVPKSVFVDNDSLSGALCSGSADVVRLQNLEHRSSGQPGVDSQIDDAETERREDEVLKKVDGLADPVTVVTDVFDTTYGEQPPLCGKEDDKHDRRVKDRCRKPDQARHRCSRGHRAFGPSGGVHADGHPQPHCEEK